MKNKLNPNARAWIKALRSGKYRQTKYILHKDGGGFCCLGVACDLYSKKVGILSHVIAGEVHYGSHSTTLPLEVANWLGLRSNCGDYNGSSLANLNDDGKRFKTIADVIESQPEGLFVK